MIDVLLKLLFVECSNISGLRCSLNPEYALGQQIETLVNNHQQQGKHQVTWNTEGLPTGIYFYRLQAGEQQATGKMVVLR